MGMFDSFYDGPREWQTKAFDCELDVYRVGDRVPSSDPQTYQVAVLGDGRSYGIGDEFTNALATVRDGVLTEVPAKRDAALPLRDYWGHVIEPANEIQWKDN